MLETVEVSAVAEALSCIILVAEWGRTSLDDVELAVSDNRMIVDRVLGILINKVPERSSRYAA
jgi:Mrp family chromosome partitioning ATPase